MASLKCYSDYSCILTDKRKKDQALTINDPGGTAILSLKQSKYSQKFLEILRLMASDYNILHLNFPNNCYKFSYDNFYGRRA